MPLAHRAAVSRLRLAAVCLASVAASCGGGGGANLPGGSDYEPEVFVPDHVLPALHVDGNRFVNAEGTTVVLKGLALADPDQLDRDGHWDAEHFAQAASWGAKVVRIPVHPSYWRARGEAGFLALLDQGVRWAEAQGMYVVLEWHGIGDPVADRYEPQWGGQFATSRAETRSFWRIAATHFKNDPGVAFFEIFNEPTTWMTDRQTAGTWAQWRPLAEGLVDVIRAQKPEAICLVTGYYWAYDLADVGANPVRRSEIGYAVHPYPSRAGPTNTTAWQADFGYLADTYPVFATEFGFKNDPSDPVAYGTAGGYGTVLHDFLTARGISWTVWVFHPVWSPQLIADWSYTPVAPQGVFYKALLQAP